MSVSKTAKILAIVFVSAIATLILGGKCEALSRYYRNYDKCMAETGGRGSIKSVEWACRQAANTSTEGHTGNACSLWIGSVSSSTIPEIVVYTDTGTTTVMYWGMCTDIVDTTSRVWVNEDGGAFDDSMNVTRAVQPGVGGRATTFNIAAFIAVASKQVINECETVYTKDVIVGRQHGTSSSTHEMEQTVKLRVIKGPNCNKGNTCNDWTPASYTSSNTMEGTTSVDMRIKNMSGRFGGTGFGAWNNNDIWAMPTDVISWITCYYPGVQRTAKTEVTRINGIIIPGNNYDPLPTNTCIEKRPVFYQILYIAARANGLQWNNKYFLSGDADSGGPLSYNGGVGDDTIKTSIVYKHTQEGDAGKTFKEKIMTPGDPYHAKITRYTPTAEWYLPCHQEECVLRKYDPKTGEEGECIEWIYPEVPCCEPWNIEGLSQGFPNTYESYLSDATLDYGKKEKELAARLQYNFTVSTDVSINYKDVYSGEQNQVTVSSVTTTVHKRYNPVTLAEYATQVPGAQVVLYAYVHASSDGGAIGGEQSGDGNVCAILGGAAKQCLELERKGGLTLNSGGSLGGGTDTIWSNMVYNAFDASAGDYMCFTSAVSPSDVAGDMDMAGGNGVFVFSKPVCAIISKKPTFQVWGDSMYARLGDSRNLKAFVGEKVNLHGGYFTSNTELCKTTGWGESCYKKTGGGKTYFGSWVEESLILKDGYTSTVASGAAAGLNNNVAGVGTSSHNIRDRSPLTFANANVEGTLYSDIMGKSDIDSGVTENREELIDYWVRTSSEDRTVSECKPSDHGFIRGGGCKKLESATGENIFYIDYAGDIDIYGHEVGENTVYLIKSGGTVTIEDNLTYKDGSYTLLGQIPKVIIYAKKGIKIDCSVNSVHAILITGTNEGSYLNTERTNQNALDGKVVTCDGHTKSENYNDPDYSNSVRQQHQLRIFGTVMTNFIDLGRTYGAAANENGSVKGGYGDMPSDGVAAEIFDYDSTILMWSEYMSGSAESDTLDTVYQHELAPRY